MVILDEKILEEQNYFVVQQNILIEKAKNDLSEYELKLIDFLISKIKVDDFKILPVKSSIQEISCVLELKKGGNTRERLKKSLFSLGSKPFWLRDEQNKKDSLVYWLDTVDIYDDNTCVLKLNDKLEPYLINVIKSGSYTQYYLRDVINLRGKYAVLLYQLLRANLYKSSISFEVDDLLDFFGKNDIPFHRFNDKYLKRALEEVSNKTDLDVSINTIRKGNKVVEVLFLVNRKNRVDIDALVHDDVDNNDKHLVPLYNWLDGESNAK